MKNINKLILTKGFSTIVSCLFVLSMSLISLNAGAFDQSLVLTVNGCEVTAVAENGNGCLANECGADRSCICVQKAEHVIWKLATEDKFKLLFSGSSPLKDTCGKNFKKSKHKCVVKNEVNKGESYQYLIKLQRCAQGSDPKIIIR
jgi:hypothetical protein